MRFTLTIELLNSCRYLKTALLIPCTERCFPEKWMNERKMSPTNEVNSHRGAFSYKMISAKDIVYLLARLESAKSLNERVQEFWGNVLAVL